MPSERDVFGKATAQAGTGGVAASPSDGGSPSEPGAAGEQLSGGAGADPGGSSNAGSSVGGSDTGGTNTGGSETAGSSVGGGDTSGSGGTAGTNAGTNAGGSTGGAFDPEAGLVAHFKFDDPDGSVAADEIDAANNGTYNGACNHPAGKLGTAVGVRNLSPSAPDWIELPTGVLSSLSSTTIALWVRDLSPSRQGGRLIDFSRGDGESLYFVPDDVNADTSSAGSHLSGSHRSASFVDLWTTSPLMTDKDWHHVTIAWSLAKLDLYVDGQARGSQASPGAVPSDLGATTPNWLGRSRDDAFIALYAEIDDLRIYDKALTSAEVAQLYVLR